MGIPSSRQCWCGNDNLIPFSSDYQRCPVCETLISLRRQREPNHAVDDRESGFYGRNYWFDHQTEVLHQPDIIQRARQDMTERCLYWLRTLLKYKIPPGQILELGAAHGGFVALLRWAGYDAVGLELSPWVVDFAHQTFGVPMLLGPVEDQKVQPGSLDSIALMDVLEHLPDPFATIHHCLSLLKAGGFLIIQTPQYPEGKTYEQIVTQGDRFLAHLVATEHLYLFSRPSIRIFFQRQGVDHLHFEPAFFPFYDMFLVVGREPFQTHSPEEGEEALRRLPEGRLVQALLDLDLQRRHLLDQLSESEIDRANRLNQIHDLNRFLQEPLRAKIWRRLSRILGGRI